MHFHPRGRIKFTTVFTLDLLQVTHPLRSITRSSIPALPGTHVRVAFSGAMLFRFIERFAQHFHCSPDRLGPPPIREYPAQLFTVHKLSPGSVTNHLCAQRFLYIQTLKRPGALPTLSTPRSAIARPPLSLRKK
jgi:hypothetical protein